MLYEDWSTKDKCWKLHGRPNRRLGGRNKSYAHLSDSSDYNPSFDDNSANSLSTEVLQNIRRIMNRVELPTKSTSSASIHSGLPSNPSGMISPYPGSLIQEQLLLKAYCTCSGKTRLKLLMDLYQLYQETVLFPYPPPFAYLLFFIFLDFLIICYLLAVLVKR